MHNHCIIYLPVAPRAGAWIETVEINEMISKYRVAPRAGAWIETLSPVRWFHSSTSHPVRVRGLKLIVADFSKTTSRPSHPVRVRGLKHLFNPLKHPGNGSSHPVRVRGLKLVSCLIHRFKLVVAPRAGAWIETDSLQLDRADNNVAPRAGAWIETKSPKNR